jgi:hypothetical protein
MKAMEEKLREEEEKAQKSLERINTLPPAERMTKFLA